MEARVVASGIGDRRPALNRSSPVRTRLRAETAAAHERMHVHPGFAAAAAGTIERSDYLRLLARLYGFHRPFEDIVRQAEGVTGAGLDVEARARSPLLLADLRALGFDQEAIANVPLWPAPMRFASEGSLLGALYVLEGSTLGGVQIARALKACVSDETGAGRSFFLGHGRRHGEMWAEFLRKLEALSEQAPQVEAAISAAIATFDAFETWMAGWKTGTTARA